MKRITIPSRVAVLTALLAGAGSPQKQAFTEWSDYAGSPSGMQYSALRQIDKGNVGQLRQAWFYPVPGTSARFGYNPLIKDVMSWAKKTPSSRLTQRPAGESDASR
jgi:hypothetical protein